MLTIPQKELGHQVGEVPRRVEAGHQRGVGHGEAVSPVDANSTSRSLPPR